MASNIVFATPGLQELIVTPDMASSWLSKRADYQRNISPVTVARYADAMRRGQWKFVPSQGIAITTEGHILDGQHRLAAIVQSGIPQRCMVHLGADAGNFAVIDRGRPRTLPQIAAMAGCRHSTSYHVAAVNTLLWKIDSTHSMLSTWSDAEIADVLDYFAPALDVAFPYGCNGTQSHRAASIRGAMLRAAISKPERVEDIEGFLGVFATNQMNPAYSLEANNLALMLRNIAEKNIGLLAAGTPRYAPVRRHLWVSTLLLLRAFLNGSTLKNPPSTKKVTRQPFPIFLDEKLPQQPFSEFVKRRAKAA